MRRCLEFCVGASHPEGSERTGDVSSGTLAEHSHGADCLQRPGQAARSAPGYGSSYITDQSEGLRGVHHLAPPLMPASFADCACSPLL